MLKQACTHGTTWVLVALHECCISTCRVTLSNQISCFTDLNRSYTSQMHTCGMLPKSVCQEWRMNTSSPSSSGVMQQPGETKGNMCTCQMASAVLLCKLSLGVAARTTWNVGTPRSVVGSHAKAVGLSRCQALAPTTRFDQNLAAVATHKTVNNFQRHDEHVLSVAARV